MIKDSRPATCYLLLATLAPKELVIETCRLRDINPWTYIAEVLALARQGIGPPPLTVRQLINGQW